MSTVIRPYNSDDLGQVLRLWESSGDAWPGTDASMRLLLDSSAVSVVADEDGRVSGCALGTIAGGVGWICRTDAIDDATRRELLDALVTAFAEMGARLVAAVTTDGEALAERGFRSTGAALYDREVAEVGTRPALRAVGGRVIPPGLWDGLRGMDEAKEIIERRVILPLAEPELAARHAVEQPKAIVLFGPPGTGKTTFAKGIASRLGWPFIEIQPSEIGAEGAERQAKLLAETFDRLLELPEAVVFVDEVEDIASIRHEERRVSPNITNEFLKQIPRMRESPHHLLVCATNSVGMLDPAFLRPGRFDYVLPVGPPNDEARASIWARYVGEITDEPVDVGVLVEASPLFTPADIEWAARKAAQRAFEREHFAGRGSRATTDDFLAAIAETRATLTPEMVEEFVADTTRFSRA
jgi:SpoVK/Ycf46/Vps4 family AAA+-type ATPase